MITATFKKKNNRFIGYEIKGHANYAPKGHDIVCAGVSALVITISEALSIQSRIINNNSFFVEIIEFDKKGDILSDLLFSGLKQIELIYPNYIKIKVI
ncbi:ribosomal-processing cysteine protease Prp [Carnobacterium divergens]|uniref:ribosomal-processing cysteine protease Prp n=1 Tax=Carnobacterium divergens TaxID=2748 RepID=UPI0039C8F84E